MAILSTLQAMEKSTLSRGQLFFSLFRTKGSPAFRVGRNWMVDGDEFKQFLKKQSEQFKG